MEGCLAPIFGASQNPISLVDLFSKASVNSVFSPTHNTWNVDLLHQLFSNQEVELINKIPLEQGLSEVIGQESIDPL